MNLQKLLKFEIILVRPRIETVPDKSLTVKEGEEVRFLCSIIEGHPEPRLTWRKKGDRMPTGGCQFRCF